MKNKYAKHYSDENLLKKITRYAKKAGTKVIYIALVLYYTLRKPDIPTWARGIIIAALGNFIVPVDLIPDIVPFIGYSDDLGALGLALASVVPFIDEDVKLKARNKIRDLFGDIDESEIEDINNDMIEEEVDTELDNK